MFSNIQNGQIAKQSCILHRRKKICETFLKILWDEGFILGYKIDSNNNDKLKIFLKYKKGCPAINSIKLLSKPSRRIYYSSKQLWKLESAKQLVVVSTNRGLKSSIECKKLNLGGEPIILVN